MKVAAAKKATAEKMARGSEHHDGVRKERNDREKTGRRALVLWLRAAWPMSSEGKIIALIGGVCSSSDVGELGLSSESSSPSSVDSWILWEKERATLCERARAELK
jgi:hypothetical protein